MLRKKEDLDESEIPSLSASALFLAIQNFKKSLIKEEDIVKELQKQQIKEKEEKNKSESHYSSHKKQDGTQNDSDGGFFIGFGGKDSKYTFRQDKKWYKHNTVRELKEYYVLMESGGTVERLQFHAGQRNFSNDNATLQSIGIISFVQITAAFRVDGGSAYYDEDVINVKRTPDWKKCPQLKPTLKPDCIMGYDDEETLRVEMPCGHVFSPITIYQYIKMFKENLSSTQIICPIKECMLIWDVDLVAAAADINADEILSLKAIIENRELKSKELLKDCPSCRSIVWRPNDLTMLRVRCGKCKGPDFCWRCAQQWQGAGFIVCGNAKCTTALINDELDTKNCGWAKSTAFNDNSVPKLRACPRCLTRVIHEKNCKHVRCWGCQKKFCFICLSLCDHSDINNEKWNCGECKLAPQQVLK